MVGFHPSKSDALELSANVSLGSTTGSIFIDGPPINLAISFTERLSQLPMLITSPLPTFLIS